MLKTTLWQVACNAGIERSIALVRHDVDARLFHGSGVYPDRHCERSEAIQCCSKILDCFVASLLAMTSENSIPRLQFPKALPALAVEAHELHLVDGHVVGR